LEDALINTPSKIKASGSGPIATPPGEPYAKYTNLQSVDEILEQISDFIGG